MFQVVPPCGGHPGGGAWSPTPPGFKSCPRVGGITEALFICWQMLVSSRAPVWGASREGGGLELLSGVSSRAPVWGASVILHKKHVANLCKICIFLPNCRF